MNTISMSVINDPASWDVDLYPLYCAGLYTPSEERPIIRVPGKRPWYAPWKRKPDQVFAGISEAMAFRAQDATNAAREHEVKHD